MTERNEPRRTSNEAARLAGTLSGAHKAERLERFQKKREAAAAGADASQTKQARTTGPPSGVVATPMKRTRNGAPAATSSGTGLQHQPPRPAASAEGAKVRADNESSDDEGADDGSSDAPVFVDVRSFEAFVAGHASGALSLPAGGDAPPSRRCGELPPKSDRRPLIVVVGACDTHARRTPNEDECSSSSSATEPWESFVQVMREGGWAAVPFFCTIEAQQQSEAAAASEPQMVLTPVPPARYPPLLGEAESDDRRYAAAWAALVGTARGRAAAAPAVLRVPLQRGTPLPAHRLWQPAPLLERTITTIERAIGGAGVAFDCGCGGGRDAAFLAARGWAVIAADHRLKLLGDAAALARRYARSDAGMGSDSVDAATAAASGGVDCVVATFDTVLNVRPRSVDLVLAVRFLHRPLLPALADAVRPGGVVLYHHFVDGVQHSAVGRPKNPAHYLRRGELRTVFPAPPAGTGGADADGFDVLVDEETTIADGRPVVNFVARRTEGRKIA